MPNSSSVKPSGLGSAASEAVPAANGARLYRPLVTGAAPVLRRHSGEAATANDGHGGEEGAHRSIDAYAGEAAASAVVGRKALTTYRKKSEKAMVTRAIRHEDEF